MKILIVEDSMLYRKAIEKYLKPHLDSPEFILAKDGEEGLELYKKENPDYVLLDLLLPKMTGQEVLKAINNLDKKKPKIIVISADVQKIVKEEVKELGAIKFINKPFTEEKAKKVAELIKGE